MRFTDSHGQQRCTAGRFAAAPFESLYAALIVFVGLTSFSSKSAAKSNHVSQELRFRSPFHGAVCGILRGQLWGVAGASIGLPILIALAMVCTRHSAARPIAILLSADGTTQMKIDG